LVGDPSGPFVFIPSFTRNPEVSTAHVGAGAAISAQTNHPSGFAAFCNRCKRVRLGAIVADFANSRQDLSSVIGDHFQTYWEILQIFNN